MNEQANKETRSYRDPMDTRHAAAAARQQRLKGQYPPVNAVYDGFYQVFEPATMDADKSTANNTAADGKTFFAGGDVIIGSQLVVENNWLVVPGGRKLVQLTDGDVGARLAKHIQAGWQVVAMTSVLYYRSSDKMISAEVGFICWDGSKLDNATMQNFSKNIANRLAHADHADLALSQEKLIQIIDSKGDWFLTGKTAYPARSKGTVVYKNHRTGTEGLVDYALQHRRGCNMLAIGFWLLLVLVIVGIVWWLFFG